MAKRSGSGSIDRRAIPSEAVETRWHTREGRPVRRIDWLLPPGPCRGSLLFLPGRGDSYEKYLETLDHWHRLGWRVTASDWRGQAGSGRFGNDSVTGHIDDFEIWVNDLAELWEMWKRTAPPPHVLVGHSMGGHLVLRALAEHKVDPDAMVLSAPMLGFHSPLPSAVLQLFARTMLRLGNPRRPAWKWSEKPGALPADRSDLLTHDSQRYGDEVWWRQARPELVMGPASWGWVAAALASIRLLERPGVLEAITTPVLVLATDHDKLVSWRASRRAAQRLPRGQLVRFGKEARHEILREADPVRDRALAAVDDFLDRFAPVPD